MIKCKNCMYRIDFLDHAVCCKHDSPMHKTLVDSEYECDFGQTQKQYVDSVIKRKETEDGKN